MTSLHVPSARAQSERRPVEGEEFVCEHGFLSGPQRGTSTTFRWHINGWLNVQEDGSDVFRPWPLVDALVLQLWRLTTAPDNPPVSTDPDERSAAMSLRDAIASTTIDRQPSAQPCDWPYHQRDADAILAMPEMQAVRGYVRATLSGLGPVPQLPDSVLSWADGES